MRRFTTTAFVLALLGVPPVALIAQTPAGAAASRPTPDATAAVDRLIASGLAYLQSKQNPDGTWGTPSDPPAITAIALRCFADAGQAKRDFVARGYAKLLSFQVEDGGIYKDLLANYNTSIAVSALAAANDPAYQGSIDRAVAYLKGLQWTPETRPEYVSKPGEKVPETNAGKQVVKDDKSPFYGGWGYGHRSSGGGRPDLSNAQIALDALHDAGVSADDPAVKRAIVFLSRCQNNSETNDLGWAGDDGGFVYGPGLDGTGDSNAGESVDAGGKRIVRSYGSMTYAGLKSMIYAGLTRDDARVKAAVGWIAGNWTLDANPGMGAADPKNAQAGLYYYYVTLGRALDAYGQPTLALTDRRSIDWRIALVEKLATLQQADGSWVGEKRWQENNPILVTAYAVQALEAAKDSLRAKHVDAR